MGRNLPVSKKITHNKVKHIMVQSNEVLKGYSI